MRIEKEVGDCTEFPLLWRLSNYTTQTDFKMWIDCVYSISYAFERLLLHSSECFWSTVMHNDSFLTSFDSVLDSLPKSFEEFIYHLSFLWEEPTSVACNQLKTTTLAVYTKIMIASKGDNITSGEWMDIVSEKFPLSRSVAVWSHFPKKVDELAKVFNTTMVLERDLTKIVEQYLSDSEQAISDVDSSLRKTIEIFARRDPSYKRLQSARLLEDFLILLLDMVTSHGVTVQVLRRCGLLANNVDNVLEKLVARIPDLMETINRCVTIDVLRSCASFLPGYPVRRLLNTVARLEQYSSEVIASVIKEFSLNERQCSMIYGKFSKSPRLIYLLNESNDIQNLLNKCSDRDRKQIMENIQICCAQENDACLLRLAKQGLFRDLGNLNMLSLEHRKSVLHLREMLPHLSVNYAHLCARYFDYDVTLAVECLLSRDSRLPLDLRQVEATLDIVASEELELITCGEPFSFLNQQRVLSTLSPSTRSAIGKYDGENSSSKNYFKGEFSLALVSSQEKPNLSVSSAALQEKAQLHPAANTSEVLDEIVNAFKKIKFDTLMTVPTSIEIEDGQRLVPMMASKKYAGVQKLKISDADKVAIRPTYEKFKYETNFSDDEYNDEYDDAFEQREFKVEPLNCEDTESEKEDEPKVSTVPHVESKANDTRNAGRGRGNMRGAESVRGQGSNRRGNTTPTSSSASTATNEARNDSARGARVASNTTYHGGKDRQNKERNKNAFKQRGADRKLRGGMI